MKKLFLFQLAIALLLSSCFPEDDGPRGFQDFEVDRLLTAGSEKIWARISRTENGFEFTDDSCNLDDILIFDNIARTATSITLNSLCPDSIIFEGVWEILQGEGSISADSIEVAFVGKQLVLDTIYDEMDSTLIIRIDTSTVSQPDTVIWVLDEITSQFLTYSFLDTLLFPFILEADDTSFFFLDTLPLEITEKYMAF